MKMYNLSLNLISYQVLGKVTTCIIDIELILMLRYEISLRKYVHIQNPSLKMFRLTKILILPCGMIK